MVWYSLEAKPGAREAKEKGSTRRLVTSQLHGRGERKMKGKG
jgi:hypothetical protein